MAVQCCLLRRLQCLASPRNHLAALRRQESANASTGHKYSMRKDCKGRTSSLTGLVTPRATASSDSSRSLARSPLSVLLYKSSSCGGCKARLHCNRRLGLACGQRVIGCRAGSYGSFEESNGTKAVGVRVKHL